MTSRFYQYFWNDFKTDIINMVRGFFETGSFDTRLNQTNICLIPKIDRPRGMTEFRPISLCNVSYKIISKLLCKRLKGILPTIVSETQSAFVTRRLITDNILLAQENFHALRTNPICRSKYMAIKTDMSKAYDRVEWHFLKSLMLKLGFAEKWVNLLMFCVSSVTYRVLINGEAKGHIKPSRGIRQGDPLSPFLFILCTEALVSLLNEAEREKKISGLKIARASPSVSHLLFADDSLFFCKADVLQSVEILNIINIYGKASGQQLNSKKSSVFFGDRVDRNTQQAIKQAIGISNNGGLGTYLGIPEQISGSKKKVFDYVQDRLNRRVSTWSARFLSKGGKEVLVKSVAQALPTYVMSCFLLPKSITSKLKSAIANFWWSSKQKSKGMHWIAWDKICIPQDLGGLGFRDLHDFNLALLAKQLWRLIQFPESLLARVLKGRYYRQSSPLEGRKPYSPSFGWRSILAGKPLLLRGLRRTIGSGETIKVWEDFWIPDIPARRANALSVSIHRDPLLRVKELLIEGTSEWNLQLLRELFQPEEIPLILGLRPNNHTRSDNYVWGLTTSGAYTVKSGYEEARTMHLTHEQTEVKEPSITCLQSQVWKLKTPRKLKHFLWQALTGCVATCQQLKNRHVGTDGACPRCGCEQETINHLIFECPPALQVWALSDFPSPPGCFPSTSIYRNLDYLMWRTEALGLHVSQRDSFPWIIWYIWKARNAKVFNGKEISPLDTLQLATTEAESWCFAIRRETTDQREQSRESTEQFSPSNPNAPRIPTCQIDASWVGDGQVSGLGWYYKDSLGGEIEGLRGCRRSLSALHAEMEGLLWAMSSLCLARQINTRFETDCSNLIKMVENPEEWPAFRPELDAFQKLREAFVSFSISLIPRSCNLRADALAKRARARGTIVSHVSHTQQVGGVLTNNQPTSST